MIAVSRQVSNMSSLVMMMTRLQTMKW